MFTVSVQRILPLQVNLCSLKAALCFSSVLQSSPAQTTSHHEARLSVRIVINILHRPLTSEQTTCAYSCSAGTHLGFSSCKPHFHRVVYSTSINEVSLMLQICCNKGFFNWECMADFEYFSYFQKQKTWQQIYLCIICKWSPNPPFLSFETKQWVSISSTNSSALNPYL